MDPDIWKHLPLDLVEIILRFRAYHSLDIKLKNVGSSLQNLFYFLDLTNGRLFGSSILSSILDHDNFGDFDIMIPITTKIDISELNHHLDVPFDESPFDFLNGGFKINDPKKQPFLSPDSHRVISDLFENIIFKKPVNVEKESTNVNFCRSCSSALNYNSMPSKDFVHNRYQLTTDDCKNAKHSYYFHHIKVNVTQSKVTLDQRLLYELRECINPIYSSNDKFPKVNWNTTGSFNPSKWDLLFVSNLNFNQEYAAFGTDKFYFDSKGFHLPKGFKFVRFFKNPKTYLLSASNGINFEAFYDWFEICDGHPNRRTQFGIPPPLPIEEKTNDYHLKAEAREMKAIDLFNYYKISSFDNLPNWFNIEAYKQLLEISCFNIAKRKYYYSRAVDHFLLLQEFLDCNPQITEKTRNIVFEFYEKNCPEFRKQKEIAQSFQNDTFTEPDVHSVEGEWDQDQEPPSFKPSNVNNKFPSFQSPYETVLKSALSNLPETRFKYQFDLFLKEFVQHFKNPSNEVISDYRKFKTFLRIMKLELKLGVQVVNKTDFYC